MFYFLHKDRVPCCILSLRRRLLRNNKRDDHRNEDHNAVSKIFSWMGRIVRSISFISSYPLYLLCLTWLNFSLFYVGVEMIPIILCIGSIYIIEIILFFIVNLIILSCFYVRGFFFLDLKCYSHSQINISSCNLQ